MKANPKQMVLSKVPEAYCVKLANGSGYIVWQGKIRPRGMVQPAIATGKTAHGAWQAAAKWLMELVQQNAKAALRVGDRLRVTKCPGTKRTIVFAGWDGAWIVSKSGGNDYSAWNVDRVNGRPVDFTRSDYLLME